MTDRTLVNAKTVAAYRLAAARYDDLFHDELEGKPDDLAWLDDFAGRLPAGALVLDAGCGPCGHVARRLADRGLRVLGVDLSPECVDIARARHPGLAFEVGDMGALDFEDASFDGLVAYYALLNTPKRLVPELFAEFHRVLKPGGLLLGTVKAGEGEGWRPDLLGFAAEHWFAHFDEDEIRRYHREAGFDLERLVRRAPYADEIETDRLFSLARKA